jgi:hypothetical protein
LRAEPLGLNPSIEIQSSISVVSKHSNICAIDADGYAKRFSIESIHGVEVGVVFPTSTSITDNGPATLLIQFIDERTVV